MSNATIQSDEDLIILSDSTSSDTSLIDFNFDSVKAETTSEPVLDFGSTDTTVEPSISFDFDYDNSTAGGTAGTDKAVTVVAIRPGAGKFVVATGTLTRSKSISISLTSETDRVYSAA